MVVNTNVSALQAQEAATNTNSKLNSSLEKLSTGLQINKASDDASGLAIADKLRTQVTSLNQSVDNGNSAVALTQIADKAMAEQSNILDVVKQKLIQAKTATTSEEGRTAIAKDISKLLSQLDNIASQTNYNGEYLLQASNTDTGTVQEMKFQMGELAGNTIDMQAGNVQANTVGLALETLKGYQTGAELTADVAGENMAVIDQALNTLNGWRADYGSTQNQVESSTRNLMTGATNLSAAESVIRDVDYANESANFSQQNIIGQAGTYALSQANMTQQNVLKLLR
jgi:flagellin